MGVQSSSHCHVDQMCGDVQSNTIMPFLKSLTTTYLLLQEKCYQYWPERLHDKYSGNKFTVTLISATSYMEYRIRCFEIRSVCNIHVVA